MVTTVTEKWGRRIFVWMKRVHNVLNKMRSKINIQKKKDRKNMNLVLASKYQNKNENNTIYT